MSFAKREENASTAFAREIIEINLRRIPWLLGASVLLAIWPIARYWRDVSTDWLRSVLIVDLLSAGVFLALNPWVRRQAAGSPWRSLYVWAAVVLALGYMDGYYFLAGRAFGQNPIYILGVIMTATVFLLPARQFLPLLVANHLVYAILLETWTNDGVDLDAVLIENTVGATVAGLVSFLLYRARREEFAQRRALASANRDLANRNAELNELMAITAHDLRSPLLGMRDLLGLASRSTSAARIGELLGPVTKTCNELIALVSRLLDAHVVEERFGKPLPLAPADVTALVAEAIDRIRPRAWQREITVTSELPAVPVELLIDAPGLAQVLDNLLGNAVKFSPAGASVSVRLARDEGRWQCDIADTGPGIPEVERASLFQKFQRGSNRPAADDASSGLGLFIAASLIRAMGGHLTYLPVEPHGSLFRMTFREDIPGRL
jgi:signal transduction histidine kinase